MNTKVSVMAGVVYSSDVFAIDEEAKRVRHRQTLTKKRAFADVVGCYAYAIGADGTVLAMVQVTRNELVAASQKAPRVWAAYHDECSKRLAVGALEAAMRVKGGAA